MQENPAVKMHVPQRRRPPLCIHAETERKIIIITPQTADGSTTAPINLVNQTRILTSLRQLSLLDPMEIILWPNPAPSRLGDPAFLNAHTLHLLIPPLRQHFLPAQRDRRPNIHFPPTLPFKWLIRAQHVQVPQRQTGRQAVLLLQRDGVGEVQETEIGGPFLGAHAHADELDFRDDEAVAAVVLAHHALQVRQLRQVFHVRLPFAMAHTRVPDLVGFDEADEPAAFAASSADAADGLRRVVGVGGDEVCAVFGGVLSAHGDVAGMALAGFDGGVDFGRVEARNDVLEAALVGGFEGGVADGWVGEGGGFDGDVEQARGFFGRGEDAAGEAGDGADGGEVEIFPGAEVADVPPAVSVDTVADAEAGYETHGRVRASKVFCHRCRWAVGALELWSEFAVGSRGSKSHFRSNEVCNLWYHCCCVLRRSCCIYRV